MAKAAGCQAKRRTVTRWLSQCDFVMLAKNHSTEGGLLKFRELSWWSSGTAQRAGVGIIAREPFRKLLRVNLPQWEEHDLGRSRSFAHPAPYRSLSASSPLVPARRRTVTW